LAQSQAYTSFNLALVLTVHITLSNCLCEAGVNCWNPAFDVTPAELITGGIVTEFGVYRPHELKDALMSTRANAAV